VCATPPAGMVAWYPADGNTLDISGGNDGTLNGGATFSAAKVDQGFSLNGTSQYVEAADTSSNSITGSISIDAWIKTNALNPLHGQVIAGKYDFSGGNNAGTSYLLTLTPSGQIEWVVYQGDGPGTGPFIGVMTSDPVTPGVWTHVAGTFDISNQAAMKVYVDGVDTGALPLGGSTSVTSINDSATPLSIGAAKGTDGSFSSFFNGLIDEVEIFNTAVNAADVAAIYNASYEGKKGKPGQPFGKCSIS